MEDLLKRFLENYQEGHKDGDYIETKDVEYSIMKLKENVLSVNQREIRSGILLSIDGVKLENNMTFTLENKENKDYSHLIDMSKILDCSDEMFKNYLEEFKSTEKLNWSFVSVE